MAEWYVKDLSKLTGISVQTLHHYDRIDLLKPSVRLMNGYRIYSEADLSRLQQIMALKFFGFELAEIKKLLCGHVGIMEHFSVQSRLLEQKASALLEANRILKKIMCDTSNDQSVPWKTIMQLIEAYRMTEKLEHSWVKEIFTPDELKQYVDFETQWKSDSTQEQKADFEKRWAQLVYDIQLNLGQDATSAKGLDIGKRCLAWVNDLYGKIYAHLRTKKFEQGFGEGKGLDEAGLTPEIVDWMGKAMDAYLRDRIYSILHQVGSNVPDETVVKLWQDVLDDMYGDDVQRKKDLYAVVLADEAVGKEAKEWLRNLDKLNL